MIWLILFLGFILRLISLDQSLWLDEGINVVAAQKFTLWGMITQYATADFHPPGWFAILWFWGKIFGYSEVSVRMPSVIFGVLTIYITYLLGKKLISKNAGLMAALLLSINPLHIYYSQEARMYALAVLAVSLNMLLFIKLVGGDKGNKGEKVAYILSNFLVLISDYVAYFIFPAQLIFLLLIRRAAFKKWIMAAVATFVLSIWWLPVLLNQLDMGASASANLPTWKFVAGGFDFKTIPLTFVKFIIGRISLANKTIYAVALLPVVSLFFCLLWRGVKSLNNLPRTLLVIWMIIPPIAATVVSLFIPVYNYFRVLYIIPGFVISVEAGILSFQGKLRYGLLLAVILIETVSSLIYLLNPNYQREDWRGVVDYFKSFKPSIILFESSGTLPPFDYYAEEALNAKGALRDFPAKDQDAVSDLEDLPKEYKDIYLVDYMVEISDPKRLVAKKLSDLRYSQADIIDFHGVGFIYHYVKND